MTNGQTVLVIEDESSISNFMTTVLNANQYKVINAKNGSEALMMITSYCPDVILLDLGLPDIDGMNIIKFVRKWSEIPIIVVSARTHEQDKVDALDSGADDYITKPFATSELLVRIRTALRHALRRQNVHQGEDDIYEVGELYINFTRREIIVAGKAVHLTQIEYRIVSILCHNAGRVMTYDSIINQIWGPHAGCDNQILRVNMANIRRKLELNPAEPKYLFTEVGVGYRMADENTRIG